MHQPVHTHAVAALQHRPSHVLVTVRVVMPHVKQYSRDAVMDLVYACSSSVEVGQRVLCPPTPRHDRWQKRHRHRCPQRPSGCWLRRPREVHQAAAAHDTALSQERRASHHA